MKEVKKFLGLGSYYRRFIRSPECQQAFRQLKDALVSPPVLAYPDFSTSFTLETDASVKGLGAVLSQLQDDHSLHPVAYASRSISGAEKRYAITELEILAVVWAVSHFHAYLYVNDVTVYTDHSAVQLFGYNTSFQMIVFDIYKVKHPIDNSKGMSLCYNFLCISFVFR